MLPFAGCMLGSTPSETASVGCASSSGEFSARPWPARAHGSRTPEFQQHSAATYSDIPKLVQLLNSKSPEVQGQAAHELGQQGFS